MSEEDWDLFEESIEAVFDEWQLEMDEYNWNYIKDDELHGEPHDE